LVTVKISLMTKMVSVVKKIWAREALTMGEERHRWDRAFTPPPRVEMSSHVNESEIILRWGVSSVIVSALEAKRFVSCVLSPCYLCIYGTRYFLPKPRNLPPSLRSSQKSSHCLFLSLSRPCALSLAAVGKTRSSRAL